MHAMAKEYEDDSHQKGESVFGRLSDAQHTRRCHVALGVACAGAPSSGTCFRFSELAYLIGGVSEKMLAQTLRALEEDGFVLRTVHATKPPKVEYSLTALGREIAERMQELTSYIEANASRVMAHRADAAKRIA
jgi:DNA-binding HxlR family transcriptional regulator